MCTSRKSQLIGVIIVFFVGLVLIISGGIFTTKKNEGARERYITEYNSAVHKWNEEYYEKFNTTEVYNQSYSIYNSKRDATYPLSLSITPDKINDNGSDIHKYYSYLRYEGKGNLFFTPTTTTTQNITIVNRITGKEETIEIIVYEQFYTSGSLCPNIKSLCDDVPDGADGAVACSNNNGYWNLIALDNSKNVCFFLRIIKEIGIIINDDGTIPSENNIAYLDFSYLPDKTKGDKLSSVDIPATIGITLRSQNDPYNTLVNITASKLNFGKSEKIYRNIAISFLTVGFVAVIGSVGLYFLFNYLERQKDQTRFERSNLSISSELHLREILQQRIPNEAPRTNTNNIDDDGMNNVIL